MPSLRRALSTPSVRVSPYPVLPSSRSHHPHPHGHRRSSGSDVSDRKVLADIDWWRVADGQRERGSEEERDVGEDPHHLPAHSADSDDPPIAILELPTVDRSESAGVELERPSTPVMPESPPVGQISGYSSQVIFINNGLLISFSTNTLLILPLPVPFFFLSIVSLFRAAGCFRSGTAHSHSAYLVRVFSVLRRFYTRGTTHTHRATFLCGHGICGSRTRDPILPQPPGVPQLGSAPHQAHHSWKRWPKRTRGGQYPGRFPHLS
jgi:hypothetical protein